jgi:hypothetical protein
MVRHDTEYTDTEGRVQVVYQNTDVEELAIHNTVLALYIWLKLPLLLRMEKWRNLVKNRLLLGGHAVVNNIRAVERTVSYQTRAKPCLFLFTFRTLFIFLLLLLFTRLLFLSVAFSLCLRSLLPFYFFWFLCFFSLCRLSYFCFIFHPPFLVDLKFHFLVFFPLFLVIFSPPYALRLRSLLPFYFFWFFCFFSLCRLSYFYFIFHPPFLVVLKFHFLLFFPLFLVIFSPPYAQFFYSSCCFISSFVFYFSFLRFFFFFVRFSPRDTGLKRLAVTSREEETKNALPLTVLLSASERHTFWLSLWCVTQYNKQV